MKNQTVRVERLRHARCKTELIKVDRPEIRQELFEELQRPREGLYCPNHDCRHCVEPHDVELFAEEYTPDKSRYANAYS